MDSLIDNPDKTQLTKHTIKLSDALFKLCILNKYATLNNIQR